MNLIQVPIPVWNGQYGTTSRGGYMKGRVWRGINYRVEEFVLHWMDGTLNSTDRTFQNPQRGASAHFGIGADGTIHQYVSIADTAFGAGNWAVNLRSINIEHEGAPGIDITDATYEASSTLLAELCAHFGITPSQASFRGHNSVSDRFTECPGTLDIPRLIQMAIDKMGTPIDQPIDTPDHQTGTPVDILTSAPAASFFVTVTVPTLLVRVAPNQTTEIVHSKTLHQGDIVECSEAVPGTDPYSDGRHTWLHTKVSGLYIWAGGTNYHQPTNQA